MNVSKLQGTPERDCLVQVDGATQPRYGRVLPVPGPEVIEDEEYVSLATYWHILLRRRWTVISVALVFTVIAVIATVKQKPIYKAVAHVDVEVDTPTIQSLNELYSRMYTDDDLFLQTQIQILKSENLAWRTIQSLGLEQNPAFAGEQADGKPKLTVSQRKLQLVGNFQSQLSVTLVPKTRMLDVAIESTDPQLAARMANALVNTYIDYNFRQKYDATRQVSGLMEQQLDELKAKVEKSQQALVDYERQNSIFNTSEKQNVQEQMLSDLSKDLATAQSDRIQKESLYNQVRTNSVQMSALVHNELLQKLEERGAELKGQYTEALNQYGPNFPKVMRLGQQVNENQTQIQREQNRVLDRIRNDYLTASNREKLALEAVANKKEELGKVNQLLVQHNILQRDFEANQQLYQSLMQKLKDATVSAGLRSTNIHMVDDAVPPTSPIRPQKTRNILIGMMAGLIFGIICAFGQEALDQSIKSVDELEALVASPVLGVIPFDTPATGRLRLKGLKDAAENPSELGLSVLDRPASILAEAYRTLRTAVLLSVAGSPPKTIVVTSAQSGEGKTSTALNLAQALAQRKGPVLLIDGDLRKAGIAGLLKVENEKGLSTILSGHHSLDQVLQQYDRMPDLWLLPSGPIPPNPADLIASEKMGQLLQECGQRFEKVVIDTPPVLAVTDAAIFASSADGVILVAAGGTTHKSAVSRMHKIIASTGARILGFALNKFDVRQQGYYGAGYYYYSSNKSDICSSSNQKS